MRISLPAHRPSLRVSCLDTRPARPSRRRVAVAVLTCVIGLGLLGACVGANTDEAQKGADDGDIVAASGSAPSGSVRPSRGRSSPVPTGTPPNGLIGQSPGPPPPCAYEGTVDLSQPVVVERLDGAVLCIGAATRVALAGSAAPVLDDRGGGYWLITATLATALGDYRLRLSRPARAGASASAGPVVVSGTVRVVRATRPRLRHSGCQLSTGTTGRVDLVGFPSRSTVAVWLYGPPNLRLRRTLPSVVVDAYGEASYTWRKTADDPTGGYAIWTEPWAIGCPGLGPVR